MPFIIVKSKNPHKRKDPVLFTSGGPGNSSLGWVNGITGSPIILDRDCIAFEQRGTRFALPYLRSFELDTALRESYRKNLPVDSMMIEGLKRFKKKLEARGIDLSGYNSDETVADIHDLLIALHIDSVNLFGGSYSGGLMLAVLQKDPSRVRSLVLDSPLPTFVPIDEDEPANFHEGLEILSRHCEKDSSDRERYANLKQRFGEYFTSIKDKVFYIPYLEKGRTDTVNVRYDKSVLLDAIVGSMLNYRALKDVPFIITEIMRGNHEIYVRNYLDNVFNRNIAPDGMRISVYCADQAAYHDEAICDCWNVPPLKVTTKQPFYSAKPVLMGDGEMDPACRPLYRALIRHYMPNSQCFLFINRSHGVGGKDFFTMTQQFLDNPFQRIEPPSKDIVVY